MKYKSHKFETNRFAFGWQKKLVWKRVKFVWKKYFFVWKRYIFVWKKALCGKEWFRKKFDFCVEKRYFCVEKKLCVETSHSNRKKFFLCGKEIFLCGKEFLPFPIMECSSCSYPLLCRRYYTLLFVQIECKEKCFFLWTWVEWLNATYETHRIKYCQNGLFTC